jgi:hypothetical protein
MATNVNINKMLEANVPSTSTDGNIVFSDQGNLYIYNQSGSKVKVSDFISVASLPTTGLTNKLYILSTDYSLNYWDGSWHKVGKDNQIVIGITNTDTTKLWLDTTDTTKVIFKWYDGTSWVNINNVSYVIQDDTTTYTQRKNLKFIGDGVTISDDSINDTTLINIGVGNSFLAKRPSNFSLNLLNEGENINVIWTNADADYLVSRELYVNSVIDISNMTRNSVLADVNTQLLDDTLGTGRANNDSYLFDSTLNTTYYFAIFNKYDVEGTIKYSSVVGGSIKAEDLVPPSNVTNLTTIPDDGKVTIKFTTSTSNDWVESKCVYKLGGYPIDENDGTVLFTETVRNTFATTGYEHSGLTNNVEVFYQIFSKDASGNINRNIANRISSIPNKIPEVIGLTISNINEGKSNKIDYTNPNNITGKNYVKTEIYQYTSDLASPTFDRNWCNSNATLLKQGGTVNTIDSFTHTPLTLNTTYNYKIFTVFSISGVNVYSDGIAISKYTKDTTPPNAVTGLTILQTTGDTLKLSWINPTGDFSGVRILMKESSTFINESDGDLIYEGNNTNFTKTGLDKTKHYYFKVIPYDNATPKNYNLIGGEIDLQMDSIPPNEATEFSLVSGVSICKLKFSDSVTSDWKMTKVIRKVGSEPISINDGTLILTNMTKDAYKNTYFIDGGLSNGLNYYYKIYSIDNFDNISEGITQIGNPIATSLPEISNFKIENIENGTKQKISWTNPFAPTGLTYVERQLFYTKDTTVALDTMTRDQCIANGLISSLNSSSGTGQGVNDSITTTVALTIGDISRYKVFVHYDSSGTAVWSSGTYDIKEVKDETPLTDITGLVTTTGDTQNTISWKNPNTSLDIDFAKVQIFRKIGTYPDGNNDLEKVYENTNQNSGNLNTFVDTGLTNNVTYYYLIKLIDISGNINVNTKFLLTPIPLPILSISYQPSIDAWSRGGINTGKNPEDLWNLYPYNSIKRILFDGTNVQYLSASDSTKLENGTNADLTINMYSRIPKFYYKYSYASGIHTWSIAETQLSGFTLFPAFVRSSINKDYIDIGCFKASVDGSNKLESKNGKAPNVDKAFSDYRTYAKNIGTNYNQFDVLSQSVLDLLFIIQYATGNVQNVFASVDDTVKTNGQTLSLGNKNGVVNGTLSLYGVEGLFGNGQYNIIDGLKATTIGYYLADNSFESMTSESTLGTYIKQGTITPSTTNGFIKDIEQVGSLFLGKDNTGSSTTGYGDMQYSVSESGLNVLCIGGSTGQQNGLFQNNFVNVSNLTSTLSMTQGSVIDSTYTEWTASVDKTALTTAFKSIGSFSLVDGTNPNITVNQVISAKLNGRVIHYN